MNFVWHSRGITPESLSCQICVAWQSLSNLIAVLNLIKKFDSDGVLLSNLIPKLSLAWQKHIVWTGPHCCLGDAKGDLTEEMAEFKLN